ncbi:hypothetical protein [Methylobacterium oxalidis]|uniref:hypothetical protein n=1 Tax=Methylobacterium oxalidis TaxID=944322 RepID=UPI0033164652
MRFRLPARGRFRALAIGILILLGSGPACFAAARPDLPEEASNRVEILSGISPAPRSASVGDEGAVEARLEVGPDRRDLRLTGDLSEGVADRVASLLAAHPEIARIHLTSDGGLVGEALALGAVGAAHGLATYVPDVCASACTLVYVRGRGRYLAAGGRLGFHGPFEVGFFDAARSVEAAPERRAYLNAGLTPDFVARALAVRPEAIWTPEPDVLRAAGVVTAVVRTHHVPDWASSPARAGQEDLQARVP